MARFVTWLRERRYSKAGAVAVALAWVVPTTVMMQGMTLTLPFPNQIADPGWVHDDDGLSETGRKNLKMQFLMTIAPAPSSRRTRCSSERRDDVPESN